MNRTVWRVLNLIRRKQILITSMGSVAKILSSMKMTPTSIGLKMIEVFGSISSNLGSYYDTNWFSPDDGWVPVGEYSTSDLFEIVFNDLQIKMIGRAESDRKNVYTCKVGEHDIGFTRDLGERIISVYAKGPEAKRALIDALRRKIPRRFEVYEERDVNLHARFLLREDVRILRDSVGASEKLIERAKKFIEIGIRRVIMLHGPPGTGKSTIASAVCDALGFMTMRGTVAEMSSIDGTKFSAAIDLIKPEAVIIDDFDRVISKTTFLDILEHSTKDCKIVFVTANSVNKIDEGLLRPGRMDEIVVIDHLTLGAVHKLLGRNARFAQDVATWPAAYIIELCRRLSVDDDSSEVIKELQARVDSANKPAEGDK